MCCVLCCDTPKNTMDGDSSEFDYWYHEGDTAYNESMDIYTSNECVDHRDATRRRAQKKLDDAEFNYNESIKHARTPFQLARAHAELGKVFIHKIIFLDLHDEQSYADVTLKVIHHLTNALTNGLKAEIPRTWKIDVVNELALAHKQMGQMYQKQGANPDSSRDIPAYFSLKQKSIEQFVKAYTYGIQDGHPAKWTNAILHDIGTLVIEVMVYMDDENTETPHVDYNLKIAWLENVEMHCKKIKTAKLQVECLLRLCTLAIDECYNKLEIQEYGAANGLIQESKRYLEDLQRFGINTDFIQYQAKRIDSANSEISAMLTIQKADANLHDLEQLDTGGEMNEDALYEVVDWYTEAIQKSEQNAPETAAEAYNRLGKIFETALKDENRSKNYYNKSRNIIEEFNDTKKERELRGRTEPKLPPIDLSACLTTEPSPTARGRTSTKRQVVVKRRNVSRSRLAQLPRLKPEADSTEVKHANETQTVTTNEIESRKSADQSKQITPFVASQVHGGTSSCPLPIVNGTTNRGERGSTQYNAADIPKQDETNDTNGSSVDPTSTTETSSTSPSNQADSAKTSGPTLETDTKRSERQNNDDSTAPRPLPTLHVSHGPGHAQRVRDTTETNVKEKVRKLNVQGVTGGLPTKPTIEHSRQDRVHDHSSNCAGLDTDEGYAAISTLNQLHKAYKSSLKTQIDYKNVVTNIYLKCPPKPKKDKPYKQNRVYEMSGEELFECREKIFDWYGFLSQTDKTKSWKAICMAVRNILRSVNNCQSGRVAEWKTVKKVKTKVKGRRETRV